MKKYLIKTMSLMIFCLFLASCSDSNSTNGGPNTGSSGGGVSTPQDINAGRFTLSNLYNAASFGNETLADPGIEGNFTNGLNDNWHFEGTVQPAQSTMSHSGMYAQQVQLSTWNNVPSNASADLWTAGETTSGIWYRASLYAKRLSGSAGDVSAWLYAPGGGINYSYLPIVSGDYTEYVYTALSPSNALQVGVNNYPCQAG